MKTLTTSGVEVIDNRLTHPGAPPRFRPSSLYLVKPPELHELRLALARGELPPDFEAKLNRLAGDGLIHRSVAQNCRLFAELLRAAEHGSFVGAGPAERDRLLRVLAYVRKDDDAIPDYKPNGYLDDQQEVRAAVTELYPLLQTFKAWRLRHQVPAMWGGD